MLIWAPKTSLTLYRFGYVRILERLAEAPYPHFMRLLFEKWRTVAVTKVLLEQSIPKPHSRVPD
jgi:hypothetical protein